MSVNKLYIKTIKELFLLTFVVFLVLVSVQLRVSFVLIAVFVLSVQHMPLFVHGFLEIVQCSFSATTEKETCKISVFIDNRCIIANCDTDVPLIPRSV